MQKIISFFTGILMFLLPSLNLPKADLHRDQWTTNYTNVFVHGLHGWGEYSPINKLLPYWGTFGGSMLMYLQARGIQARGASIDVNNSAWDCACEMYAQITGTRTDYGAAHSAACHHDRFGADYTGKALVKNFSAENKVNLFGHSFGGVTILMLADLMKNGSEAEIAATPADEISPLFTGGKGDWIYSLTTLCAPLNGTTAYEMLDRRAELGETVFSRLNDALNLLYTTKFDKEKAEWDNSAYEMHIDESTRLTNSFEVQDGLYYFSLPCSHTRQMPDGTWKHKVGMEWIMADTADAMGQYTCVTKGGVVVDETWLENDGLVNTISQRAPFQAPQQDLDKENIQKGVWNIYPTHEGDHMSLIGGFFTTIGIRELYTEMIDTINCLPAEG